MPAPKRTASDSFSSSQQLVVKRQKSDANLSNGSAIAVVGNNAQNGALVQSVCHLLSHKFAVSPAELKDQGRLMEEMVRSYEPAGCKLPLWSSQVFWPAKLGHLLCAHDLKDTQGKFLQLDSILQASILHLDQWTGLSVSSSLQDEYRADWIQYSGAPTDSVRTTVP